MRRDDIEDGWDSALPNHPPWLRHRKTTDLESASGIAPLFFISFHNLIDTWKQLFGCFENSFCGLHYCCCARFPYSRVVNTDDISWTSAAQICATRSPVQRAAYTDINHRRRVDAPLPIGGLLQHHTINCLCFNTEERKRRKPKSPRPVTSHHSKDWSVRSSDAEISTHLFQTSLFIKRILD